MEPKGRLARWIMDLQEFHFTTDRRPGMQNGNADALSRLETEQNTTTDKLETRQSHNGAVCKPDSLSSQKQKKRQTTITLILQKEPTEMTKGLSQDTISISNDKENTDKIGSNSTESSPVLNKQAQKMHVQLLLTPV